ncbi:MAG: hypothetical protein ACYTXE_28365 [Nostoc sp.]
MPKNKRSYHKPQEPKPRKSGLSFEIALPQAAVGAIFSFLIGVGAVVIHIEQHQTQLVQQKQSIQQQCQSYLSTPPQVQSPQQLSMLRKEVRN